MRSRPSDFEPAIPAAASLNTQRARQFIAIAVVLLLLAAIFIPPLININRFRRSIVHSISAGLGRPIEASSVEFQLFPRPGFILHHLTVSEDPAFGAEPFMIAETVTAGLRASTLWHRRIEIATLRFDTPSVNLTRDPQGRWNFESLLQNSPALHSKSATAPGTRPMPFPYVEASDARINFKFGVEKLPFSLERSNLVVWKDSDHEWRLRIKAHPTRTDLTLADAGEIRGEGKLITAGPLMSAPIHLNLEWRRVQLGEISRLLQGDDNGWRGTVDWTATINGTLDDVTAKTDIAVQEFRRAEFIPATEMDLAAHCQLRYAHYERQLDALTCNLPLAEGLLHVVGRFAARTEKNPAAAVSQLTLLNAPAGLLLDLFAHIHPGVAADATASGQLDGAAECIWQNASPSCTGEAHSSAVRFRLANIDQPLTIAPLQLTSSPANASASAPTPAWTFAPAQISFGTATPARLIGSIDSIGYSWHLDGTADLTQLNRLAQALKIPATSGEVQSIRGTAQLALSLENTWLPRAEIRTMPSVENIASAGAVPIIEFAPSRWSGHLQIENAVLKLASFPATIQLASAHVNLTPTGVEWTSLQGTFARIPFDGSIRWQTPCAASQSSCARTFALHTPNLSAERLQAALHGTGSDGDLLSLINPWSAASPQLPEISGTVTADVLSLGKVSIKNAALQLDVAGHTANLTAISGNVFGGVLTGNAAEKKITATLPLASMENGTGALQWGDGAPIYRLHVALNNIQPAAIGTIWQESWGPGSANATLDLKTQGWSTADLSDNATGKYSFSWINGAFQHSSTAPTAIAIEKFQRFQRWTAAGTIRDRTLILDSAEIIPQPGSAPPPQSVIGTINFARVLDLHLQPSGISITGPIESPIIAPAKKSPAATSPQQSDRTR